MKIIKYFFFPLFLLIIISFLFHKNIVSFVAKKTFSNWLERDISFNIKNINYSNDSIILEKIKVKNDKEKERFENLIEIEKIYAKIDRSTLFEKTVIIDNLIFFKPQFYYVVKLDKNTEYSDNINVAAKLDENSTKKIWKKNKKKDKNFKIKKLEIKNSSALVSAEFLKEDINIKLSNMYFTNVGNEKNITHYKDVMGYILADITGRIADRKFRNFIKKHKNKFNLLKKLF